MFTAYVAESEKLVTRFRKEPCTYIHMVHCITELWAKYESRVKTAKEMQLANVMAKNFIDRLPIVKREVTA